MSNIGGGGLEPPSPPSSYAPGYTWLLSHQVLLSQGISVPECLQ